MSVAVDDAFGATSDPALPTLRGCLDPRTVQDALDVGIAGFDARRPARLRAIRVVRYKPGRRCLVEYDISVVPPAGDEISLTMIGKIRRNRPGRHQLRLLQSLWSAGFDDRSEDGIHVPEPLGEIPHLAMWLQRRVAGVPSTRLLAAPGGGDLAERLVDAARKVHAARVPTRKTHGIADELRVLDACLPVVAARRPALAGAIRRLTRECVAAAGTVPALPHVGIHRDFYPDQVLVDDDRLTIVDFDLYTAGDPALDIGNLLGHVTEQALRELGSPTALAHVEDQIEERFWSLAGARARRPARLYAALTLARHVFLADERPERARIVPELVELARERVGAVRRLPATRAAPRRRRGGSPTAS